MAIGGSGPDEPTEIGLDRTELETTPPGSGPGSGRYRLEEVVGRGGMGIVWRAWDTQLRRRVALKQIRGLDAGDELRARFLREARAAARLRHPAIVAVHDIDLDGEHPYITSDFIEGASLDVRIAEGALDADAAVGLVRTVAEALDHAHQQGIVHRDVKPANILIDAAGRAHLTDFGLARDLAPEEGEEDLTGSGRVLGTPRYMSPEQITGPAGGVGPASDQFSLGVVLFELLTGQAPFAGDSLVQLFDSIRWAAPGRLTGVDRTLARICRRALAKEAGRRYPTTGRMADDLGRWLERPRRPKASRSRAAIGAALALAAVLCGWWVWPRSIGVVPADPEGPAVEPVDAGRRAVDGAAEACDRARRLDGDPGSIAPELERAAAALEAAIEREPRRVELLLELGRVRRGLGDFAAAETAWSRALEIDPAHVEARLAIGLAATDRAYRLWLLVRRVEGRRPLRRAEQSRCVDQAAAAFEGAGTPADPVLRAIVAGYRAYVADDREQAWRSVAEGLAHPEGERGPELRWLRALLQTSDPGARQALDDLLARWPGHLLGRYARGLRALGRGDLDAAGEDLRILTTIAPRFADAHLARGLVAVGRGEDREALAHLDRALELDPSMVEARYFRASVLHAARQEVAAREEIEAALTLDPGCESMLVLRAIIRLAQGEAEGAIADCQAALAGRSSDVTALQTLAAALHAVGRWDEAVAAFDRCLDGLDALEAGDPAVRFPSQRARLLANGALSMARGGRLAEAEARMEEALSSAPEDWADRDWAVRNLSEIRAARGR